MEFLILNIHLLFLRSPKEDEVILLLGSYIEVLWFRLFEKGELSLRFDDFLGYLNFRFKEASQGNRKRLIGCFL